jgi:hypothetical protein
LKLLVGSAAVRAVWPAPADGIGDGVTGGFNAAEAATGCGAGGGAGVDVETEGVEGMAAVFGGAAAGATLG